MAQLVVRNLDDVTKAGLCALAAQHKRSLEEEVRHILNAAAQRQADPPKKLGTWFADLFHDNGLKDPIHELRGQPARPARFE